MKKRTLNVGVWAMAFDYLSVDPIGYPEIHEVGEAALEGAMFITFMA